MNHENISLDSHVSRVDQERNTKDLKVSVQVMFLRLYTFSEQKYCIWGNVLIKKIYSGYKKNILVDLLN